MDELIDILLENGKESLAQIEVMLVIGTIAKPCLNVFGNGEVLGIDDDIVCELKGSFKSVFTPFRSQNQRAGRACRASRSSDPEPPCKIY